MIERLQMKNGVRRAFRLVALLVGSAFLLNDSAMAVSTQPPAPVLEVSSGWVLLPVVLAVLLVSSRQILRRRAAQKS
jgi:hypothetical protein